MNSESTITSITEPVHGGGPRAREQLIVVASSDDPRMPSSRHVLDGIDVVRFGRGEREARRHADGSQSVLTLRLPDRRISGDHGSMRRIESGWLLDDPRSRNGVVINGGHTRRGVVVNGALLELGHTFLYLRSGPLEETAPPDVDEAGLHAPEPTLATFDGQLTERFAQLARVAPEVNVSVLLLGETGTGKEVVARALHQLSGRRGAFFGVNCGAIPSALLESELFGHRRGAFTGAVADRPGYVRSAEGGTLFLDEIGELPAASQAALLRVLADRTVMPVGEDRAVPVDVRLCSATLRDLSTLVQTDRFRRDLYSRLAGFKLRLPALRERRVDFGLLLRALLARIPRGDGVTFAPAALRELFRYDWPHNIREFETVLMRAVALSPEGIIDLPHLELQQSIVPQSIVPPRWPHSDNAIILPPGDGVARPPNAEPDGSPRRQGSGAPRLPTAPVEGGAVIEAEGGAVTGSVAAPEQGSGPHAPPPPPPPPPSPPPEQAGAHGEADLSSEDQRLLSRLLAALRQHHGNVNQVARALGVRRQQVYRWMKRFGLHPEDFRD